MKGTATIWRPRPPADVAQRALVLAALAQRASVDELDDLPRAAERAGQGLAWLRAVGVEHVLEPQDRAILQAPHGSLLREQRAAASSAGEMASALAWALALRGPLEPLVRADALPTSGALLVPPARARELVQTARLLPAPELAAWHREVVLVGAQLRARQEARGSRGRGAAFDLSTAIVPLTRQGLVEIGNPATAQEERRTRELVGGLDDYEVQSCLGIYFVRKTAIEWLGGLRASFWGAQRLPSS